MLETSLLIWHGQRSVWLKVEWNCRRPFWLMMAVCEQFAEDLTFTWGTKLRCRSLEKLVPSFAQNDVTGEGNCVAGFGEGWMLWGSKRKPAKTTGFGEEHMRVWSSGSWWLALWTLLELAEYVILACSYTNRQKQCAVDLHPCVYVCKREMVTFNGLQWFFRSVLSYLQICVLVSATYTCPQSRTVIKFCGWGC